MSAFVLDAAGENAERVIAASTATSVPSEFFEQLWAALDAPPQPNEPLRRRAANRAGYSSAEAHNFVSEPLADRHQLEQFSSGHMALDLWRQRDARMPSRCGLHGPSCGKPETRS